MNVDELDFELPDSLIAQAPLPDRDAARLLVLCSTDGSIVHAHVRDLPSLLKPSLWVVNNTRVMRARLRATRPSGGKVELLLLQELTPGRWKALARASKSIRVGDVVSLAKSGVSVKVVERNDEGHVIVVFEPGADVDALQETEGEIPLPPYIKREADASDSLRYQTLFAKKPGAVAAPTASLHFTQPLLEALSNAGHTRTEVTLHVGLGTFAPIKASSLTEHPMHEESYEISASSAKAISEAQHNSRPIVAVGTTVVRTLEAATEPDGRIREGDARTRLLLYPPYTPKTVSALMTNFHVPRSTLLALVMAFGGIEPIRNAYREAVKERYRFFSYGDAMLIAPRAVLSACV